MKIVFSEDDIPILEGPINSEIFYNEETEYYFIEFNLEWDSKERVYIGTTKRKHIPLIAIDNDFIANINDEEALKSVKNRLGNKFVGFLNKLKEFKDD